jgi:hypothetical protein
MRKPYPVAGSVGRDLEHRRGVRLIDSDLGDLQRGCIELVQEGHRGDGATGSVDDQIRRNTVRRSPVVLVQNRDGVPPISGRRDIGDTRSTAKLDVQLLPEPPPADVFEQGPGETEGVEAEIALGERIEAGLFVSNGEAGARPNSASF